MLNGVCCQFGNRDSGVVVDEAPGGEGLGDEMAGRSHLGCPVIEAAFAPLVHGGAVVPALCDLTV